MAYMSKGKPLSPRQTEVFRLAGDGYSANQIGAELGMSGRTVEKHLVQVKLRLGVSRKQELVPLAREYFNGKA